MLTTGGFTLLFRCSTPWRQVNQLNLEVGNVSQAKANIASEWQLDVVRKDAALKESETKRAAVTEQLKTLSKEAAKTERQLQATMGKKMDLENAMNEQFKKVLTSTLIMVPVLLVCPLSCSGVDPSG